MFVVALVVGAGIGYAWGGPDRSRSARTAALTAIPVSAMLFIDRLMQSWDNYNEQPADQGPPDRDDRRARRPTSRATSGSTRIDTFTHLLLPTIALILISFAATPATRGRSMLEVMNQDYIRTARSKGLTERTVIMRHAFRNALHPARLDRRRSTSSR